MRIDGDDEEVVAGTEGEDAAGTNGAGRDEDSEVSAEHADDQEDDGEQEVEPEVDEQPARGTRGGNRIQRLANEAKAAREEAAAARREAEEFRRQVAARQSQESEEQRQARRALMTPEERINDDMAQMRREFAQQQQQTQFQTAAMLDRSAYEAKAAVNPIYGKYRDVIEEQFQRQLAQGRPVEREILLQNHLGRLALESAGRSGGQRKAARARVESQRVPAGSGKGDQRSDRGKAGDTAESRLKGMVI